MKTVMVSGELISRNRRRKSGKIKEFFGVNKAHLGVIEQNCVELVGKTERNLRKYQ